MTPDEETRERLKLINKQLTVTNGLLLMLVSRTYLIEISSHEDLYTRYMQKAFEVVDALARDLR